MTILVTGSTGVIGSRVVANLAAKGADVHALARSPEKAKFPDGVSPVKADLMDIEATRKAIAQASTLFLLNAVTPDELTQALLTLSLAREAGVKGIVYLSDFHSDLFTDVPHFTGKHTVERMIEDSDLPATILRPNYFMQNDAALTDAIMGHGVYPQPIGSKGFSMVDARDIADIAASSLLKRENAATPLPREMIELVGSDVLTGEAVAQIWSGILGRGIRYGERRSRCIRKAGRSLRARLDGARLPAHVRPPAAAWDGGQTGGRQQDGRASGSCAALLPGLCGRDGEGVAELRYTASPFSFSSRNRAHAASWILRKSALPRG
jgi:uncharacterized protein YbjT (DUF2867 family)